MSFPAQLLGFWLATRHYDGLRVNTSSQSLKLQSLNEFGWRLSPGVTCQSIWHGSFRAANGVGNEFSLGCVWGANARGWKGQTPGSTLYIGRAESSDNTRYLFGPSEIFASGIVLYR